MNNCCLSYLFFCTLSGIFVFIILGILTYTNNPFLIIENMKKDDSSFDENTMKAAYLQYFIAALFSSFFSLIIYILNIFLCEKKRNIREISKNKKEIEIINSVGSNNLINNDNINNNNNNNQNDNVQNISNEINTNLGMTENEY